MQIGTTTWWNCSGENNKATTYIFWWPNYWNSAGLNMKRKLALFFIRHWAEHQVCKEHHVQFPVHCDPFTDTDGTFLFHASAVFTTWCMKMSLSWHRSRWGCGICRSIKSCELQYSVWMGKPGINNQLEVEARSSGACRRYEQNKLTFLLLTGS